MGEVYRAHDTTLGRDVALKVLRWPYTSDPDRMARLEHEARMLATLNHPNIAAIYGLAREESAWGLVLELIDGSTLAERIATGPLPLREALAIGRQIADALDAAHQRGIVHRDLKPSNIKVTPGGVVKLLDFGVATMAGDDQAPFGLSPEQPTQTAGGTRDGLIRGTVAYMSPEQARGEPVDKRADVWAFGCVLYELLTGRRAFPADSVADAVAAVLGRDPDWTALPPAAPPGMLRLLKRCLEKDRRRRLRDIGDAQAEIDAVLAGEGAAGTPPPAAFPGGRYLAAAAGLAGAVLIVVLYFGARAQSITSIAVVPFAIADRAAADEYLGDGLTEGVIDRLGELPQSVLKVIAINSVLQYKGRSVDASLVGRELNVGAVVIGTISRRAGRLVVSTELVNTRDRSHIWGKTYDATIPELPGIQAEIADGVSKGLRLRLTPAQGARLVSRAVPHPEAYHLYLKGRYFWNQYNEDGWLQAIQYFRQAIDLDKEYALAWAGLADAYYGLSSLVLLPSEAIPSARAAAERALAIDPDLAEAHAALGVIKEQYDWDPQGAATEYRRALELNPNFAIARERYGVHLFAQGEFEAALVELNKAQELDPLSMVIGFVAVWPLPHLGQDERAIRQLEKLAELFPKVPETRDVLHDARGQMYLRQDRSDAAVTEFLQGSKIKTLCGDDPLTIERLQRAYRAGGLKGYWSTQLEFAVPRYEGAIAAARTRSPQRYVSSIPLAELYARAGDNERALALLQDSYRNRDENLRWLKAESLLPNSPWETVRRDPRFADMLRGMGLDGPAPAPVAAR